MQVAADILFSTHGQLAKRMLLRCHSTAVGIETRGRQTACIVALLSRALGSWDLPLHEVISLNGSDGCIRQEKGL